MPLPNGGMSLEELQRYVDANPGPVADVGFNPNNPGPTDISAQGPSVFDRITQTTQGQQLAGNIGEPIVPDSIKAMMPPSAEPAPEQEALNNLAKTVTPYKPQPQVASDYAFGADANALSQALQNQQQMNAAAMLGRAGATIGAGIAGIGNPGAGKAATEGYESLEKMGEQGVKAVQTKRAAEDEAAKHKTLLLDIHDKESMEDPNSPVSQYYRAVASKGGLKVPENLPAAKLKDLGIKLPINDKKKYQFITIEDENGRPVVALADPDTGQVVPTGLARGYAPKVDPRTGEFADSSNLTKPVGSITPQPAAGTTPAQPGTQQNTPQQPANDADAPLNVRQEKEILARQTKIYGAPGFKDAQQFIQEAQTAKSLTKEAQTNPMAYNMLGTVVARAFQGGRLTDKDVVMYTGRRDYAGKLEQTIKEATSGTFTKENAELLSAALDAVMNKEQHVVDDIYKQESEKIAKGLKIPQAAVLKRLAPDSKIGERDPKIEEWAKQYHYDYDTAERLLRARGYGH